MHVCRVLTCQGCRFRTCNTTPLRLERVGGTLHVFQYRVRCRVQVGTAKRSAMLGMDVAFFSI